MAACAGPVLTGCENGCDNASLLSNRQRSSSHALSKDTLMYFSRILCLVAGRMGLDAAGRVNSGGRVSRVSVQVYARWSDLLQKK